MSMHFSKQTEGAVLGLLPKYPQKRAALIPALHLIQKELGHVPDSAQEQLAKLLDIPPTWVKEVVSFYTMFSTQPVGKCHLSVCRTLSCAMRGGGTIIKKLEAELGIKVGETTQDGAFTLSSCECLALCGTAPAMLVNGDNVENLDWAKVKAVLERERGQTRGGNQ